MNYEHQLTSVKSANGITIVDLHIKNYPISSSSFFVDAGSRNDPLEKLGLSHLIEHLLFNKTNRFASRQELLEMIEEKGILFNAFTGLQAQQYFLVHPMSASKTALEVLVEGLTHCKFEEETLEREKNVVLQEARDNYYDVSTYIWRLANKGLLGSDKLGKDFYGTSETIEKITIEDINEFYQHHFSGNNITFLLINSPLSPEEQLTIIDQAQCPHNISFQTSNFYDYKVAEQRVCYEQRDNADQVHLSISLLGPALNNIKDRVSQDLIQSYLASGWTSRLIQRLRVDKNFTYWVNADSAYLKDIGFQRFSLSTDQKNVHEVLSIIAKELADIPNPIRFEAHKTKFIADLERNLVDYSWIMNWYGYLSVPQSKSLYVSEYTQMMKDLKIEDVRDFFNVYINNNNINLAYIYKESIEDIEATFQLPSYK